MPAYTLNADLKSLIAALPDPAGAYGAFGGRAGFEANLTKIVRCDNKYGAPQIDRDVFNIRSGRAGSLENLLGNGLLAWKDMTRPSLPALAMTMLERMGYTSGKLLNTAGEASNEKALARALLLVAARGEMIRGQADDLSPSAPGKLQANPYHNARHTGHVAVITDYLLQFHNHIAGGHDALPLTREDRLTALLAAFAHDIDHPGRNNPPDQPMKNEEDSFAAIRPILRAAGVKKSSQDDILAILRATSPNGPHKVLKTVAQINREGRVATPDEDNVKKLFPELDILSASPVLVQLATTVEDADLYMSAAGGLTSNKKMSSRLTEEFNQAGMNMDCRNDGARLFFLNEIVGKDGFASPAGRYVANDMIAALRVDTKTRIDAAPKIV